MQSPGTTPAISAPIRQPSLDVLRFVAVLGVVGIHVFAAVVTNDALRGGTTWWTAVAIDLGFVWVVPVFVMVSGALILDPRMHAQGPGDFYRRRLLRLGPAIVFWPIFYIGVVRILISGDDMSVGEVVAVVLQGQPYTHLYFLWLIVGLYVVAPVLEAFLARGGRRRAFATAAAVLTASVLVYSIAGVLGLAGRDRPITLDILTQWIPYVGFFLAGWALKDVVLRRTATLLVALGTVLCLAEVIVQYGSAPPPILRAIAPVSYLGPFVAAAALGVFVTVRSVLASWTPGVRTTRVLRTLSDAAFGVYLVHFAFMIILRTLFPAFAEAARSSIPGAAAMWLAVVALSLALAVVARRIPFLRRLF